MISFKKAFERLKEAGYSTYRIRKEKIIGERGLQNLRRGQVNTSTIEMLCRMLRCQPGEIMEWIEEGEEKEERREKTVESKVSSNNDC